MERWYVKAACMIFLRLWVSFFICSWGIHPLHALTPRKGLCCVKRRTILGRETRQVLVAGRRQDRNIKFSPKGSWGGITVSPLRFVNDLKCCFGRTLLNSPKTGRLSLLQSHLLR
jgi:hypothetical protein